MSQEALRGASANRQDGARLDIAANGFWGGTFERTYFDVRVFNPYSWLKIQWTVELKILQYIADTYQFSVTPRYNQYQAEEAT